MTPDPTELINEILKAMEHCGPRRDSREPERLIHGFDYALARQRLEIILQSYCCANVNGDVAPHEIGCGDLILPRNWLKDRGLTAGQAASKIHHLLHLCPPNLPAPSPS